MAATKDKKSPLMSLMAAALSMPGYAANQPLERTMALTGAIYDEESVADSAVLTGSPNRYDIDVGRFMLVVPFGKAWGVEVSMAREVMSGASPWGTVADSAGKSALIMSGATIDDSRNEVGITLTRYLDDSSYAFSATRSDEDDYDSNGYSVSGSWDINDSMTTISAAVNYTSDTLTPTDAVIFNRIQRAEKDSRAITLGATQIINRSSTLQLTVGYTSVRGYLSDPYKLRDIRPDNRRDRFIVANYRKFYESFNAAMHFDYRYYEDSFGVHANTFQFDWHQNINASLRISPSIRFYRQNSADFFRLVDDFSSLNTISQSSDHRLGNFDALSPGLAIRYAVGDWALKASGMRYISEDRNRSTGHPAELEFTLYSMGIEWKF